MFGRTWLAVIGIFMLSASVSHAVVIDGKDWRQPIDTVNISWNQLDAIYDTSTGLLDPAAGTTMIGGIDFDGWIWADISEVGSMFSAAGIGPAGTFTSPASYSENTSSWAPAFIDIDGTGSDTGYFSPTWVLSTSYFVGGVSRDLVSTDPTSSLGGAVTDRIAPGLDFARTNDQTTVTFQGAMGAWLYRDSSSASVPSPATLPMLAGGLALLHMRRRRRLS